MATALQSDSRNILLRRLSTEDYARLAGSSEGFEGAQQDILGMPGETSEFVHLPETGIASVMSSSGPRRLEVGMVGREGFVGLPVLLSDGIPSVASVVLMPGTFVRIPAGDFRAAVFASPAMLALVHRYLQAYLTQVACTAFTNGIHNVEQRLSRWLLMISDRTERDELPLTHELVAAMLGVRRPGITVATHVLEGEHAIRAQRGRIRIVSRKRLRWMAGDSYGAAEAEYERLIGVSSGPSLAA